MIDFDLSPQQQAIRTAVASFANTHLQHARDLYEPKDHPHQKWEDRFRSIRSVYREAVTAGLIKAQIPQALGGNGTGALVDAAIVAEEMYAVDASVSLTILGTGLGLTPLILAGSPELQTKYLQPFLRDGGEPLASLVFSEPAGSANFAEAGGSGFGTVAVEEGEEYVITGEKIWATNCSGWDDRGADLQCVVCRIPGGTGHDDDDVRSQVAIVIVTREDIAANDPQAYRVLTHPQTIGHTAVNGPHVRFHRLHVPKSNLLAPPGQGADVVDMTFTASATIVGAMGVGIMRQTFDKALAWAKTDRRGGREVMLQKQSVADLLIKIKTRCEASRALVWKACHAFGKTPWAAELCYEAKILGSENAVESLMHAINAVGVSSYSRTHPFGDLLNDAVVLPIFDGGNVGVRRRQIEKIFADPAYDPWASTFGHTSNDGDGKSEIDHAAKACQ